MLLIVSGDQSMQLACALFRKRGGTFALATILGIWLMSAALASPAIVYSKEISFDG